MYLFVVFKCFVIAKYLVVENLFHCFLMVCTVAWRFKTYRSTIYIYYIIYIIYIIYIYISQDIATDIHFQLDRWQSLDTWLL